MPFTAKYETECNKCHKMISVGQQAMGDKLNGYMHQACGPSSEQSESGPFDFEKPEFSPMFSRFMASAIQGLASGNGGPSEIADRAHAISAACIEKLRNS